jgi:hypothetical protein
MAAYLPFAAAVTPPVAAAGPVIAAELTAAEVISAAVAQAEAAAAAEAIGSAAAAELATQGPLQAAINESMYQANLLDSANAYSKLGLPDPFENFLRSGVDADMPGATMRSIQSGMQNAPLNTLRSLPQYLGAPATQGGSQALQAARLVNQPSQGQRTSYSPPMMNRGREVTLASPVQSLLGEQPKPRRKPTLSLLG